MKSYLKFLSRNKLYTAIEAVGLATSLALVVIIGTSLYDQYQITHAVPGIENIYRVTEPTAPGMEYRNRASLESFPEVIRSAAFIYTSSPTIKTGDGNRPIKLLIAEPALLEMIPLQVQDGSLDLFKEGAGVVMTTSAAQKYFPKNSPVGEILSLGQEGFGEYGTTERDELTVAAIVEDPTFSLLADFDMICPAQSSAACARAIRESEIRNTGFGFFVCVLAELTPGTEPEEFAQKFADAIGFRYEAGKMISRLNDLYYSSVEVPGIRQGNRLYPQVLLLLGILLLLSAILIFVTLSSALSGNRAKEMATRRLIGASKHEIFWRIIAEHIFFTTICYGFAILLALAIFPGLNTIRLAGLTVPFRVSASPAFQAFSLLCIVFIGFVAGLVPARLLSSYRPIDVVSGQVRRQRKMVFNKICVGALSFLALTLIPISLTLEAQLRHLETLDQGTDPSPDLFYFHPHSYSRGVMQLLGERLMQEPQVETVCYTDGIPAHIRSLTMAAEKMSMPYITCDSAAFRLLGFRVQEEYEQMRPGCWWISETARLACGISAESAEIVKVLPYQSGESVGGIIGDFRRISLNGYDPWEVLNPSTMFPPSVFVTVTGDESLNGILIRTKSDHKAFRECFLSITTDFYREHVDAEIPDFTNDRYSQCGYLEEIAAADYDELRRYVRIIEVFTLITMLLAMFGLLAICTWFTSVSSKDIAIRKVFGGTVEGEAGRIILRYLSYVLIAVVVSIPVSVFLTGRLLERWSDRISCYWWIFVVSVLFVLLISTMAILWQSWKAAKTNPAIELKKE